ncbi:MAG: dihydrolipoamide acyltransferase [Deltaproteobacteria bacterium]|nr:dihydrolipoamide acyltransferase [Deltaproteobacteria bacterium]
MHEIRVPKLGETMEEAQIIEWLAEEGETVEPRQVLVILQTEKAGYELEAQYGGILHIITPADPDVDIPVTHLIGLIAETQEEYEKIKSEREASSNV